jgi:serine/threonine protein kinase
MSPEQAQGRPVGPASDVFSLGAVLAFASAGAPAFGTGSVAALVYRVVSEAPELDQVPPRLRPLVAACLAKKPGDRPSLADVLVDVGSGLIRRDWLPDTVADTIARYEPAARLAALAALDSSPLTGGPGGGPTRSPTRWARPARGVRSPGVAPSPPPWPPWPQRWRSRPPGSRRAPIPSATTPPEGI